MLLTFFFFSPILFLHLSTVNLIRLFQPCLVYMHLIQHWLPIIALDQFTDRDNGGPCLHIACQHDRL